MQCAPVAVAVLDREMRYVAASRRWLDEHQLDDSAIGRSHDELFPEAPRRWREDQYRALEGETLREGEGTVARAGSALQLLRWRICPWRDAGGEICGVIMFTERIADRKDAEESARRDKLRLQLALDAASLISFDWDIQRDEVRRYNPYAALPAAGEQAFRSFQAVLDAVHPDDRDRFLADVRAAMNNEGGRYESEIRVLCPDGATAWFLERGRVERDAKGQPARLIGVVQDVTKRKRAEEALREADRRKDEFLATLAHELRNPLAPICNGMQILRRTLAEQAADRDRHLLDMMERQVCALTRLVDELLEISRISRGRIELRKEWTDIASVLRNALETSQPQVEKGRHRATLRLPSALLPIHGDPMRLTQVFTNIVNNAAKYTPAGGRIEIEAERQGDAAVVKIRDNGCGISCEALPRVFDLFAQVDEGTRPTAGGLGIGLALVRRLIELHGGEVEARSEGLGKGSEFCVSLPLDPAPRAPQPCSATEPQAPMSAKRVLVIDDQHDVADSLGMLLESLGAVVRVVYDGAAGVESCAEFEPNLILVDLGMPQVDGYETARRIRASLGDRRPTLVALTGWGQDSDRARSLAAGFDAHLMKPASAEALEALAR